MDATTLDGFIADPDDSLAWLLRQPQEPGGPLGYEDFIAGIGAVVMGSTTYEWLLAHPEENGGGWPYPMPAWVLTSRPLLPRRLDLELLDSGRNGAFTCARYRVAGPLAEDRDA